MNNDDIDFLNKNKITNTVTGAAKLMKFLKHVMTMILNLTKNIVNYDKLKTKNGNL